MQKKSFFVFLVLAVLAVAGYQLAVSTGKTIPTMIQPAADAAPVDKVAMRPADVLKRLEPPSPEQLKAHYHQFMAKRPAYLADVELPADYSVDENGNLIVNSAIKDVLDYFMLGIGDIPFDELHDIIAGNMHTSLQEPALSQALALLDRYFAYIDSYDRWEKGFDKNRLLTSDPAAMKSTLMELENLRRQMLGDDVYAAFFAEEAQANLAYVEAREALQQPGLTVQEKADIAATLEQSLPDSMRVAQQQAMTQVHLAEQIRGLRDSGASDTELHSARAALVGEAAAQRLDLVDQENRIWEEKRSRYKALFTSIPGTDGLGEEEKNQYVADIARQELGLSDNELKRMHALDRIEAAEAIQ